MGSQGWSLTPQSDHLGVYKVTEEIIEPGRLWESHSHLLHVDPEMHPAGKQYGQKGSGLRMRGSKTLFSFFPTVSHSKSFAFFFSFSNLQAIKKPLQCAYTFRPSRQSMTPCVIWSTALRWWGRLVTQSPVHPGMCSLLLPAENHACVGIEAEGGVTQGD